MPKRKKEKVAKEVINLIDEAGSLKEMRDVAAKKYSAHIDMLKRVLPSDVVIEANNFTAKLRETATLKVPPDELYKLLDDSTFLSCVNIILKEARKYLSEKELEAIGSYSFSDRVDIKRKKA